MIHQNQIVKGLEKDSKNPKKLVKNKTTRLNQITTKMDLELMNQIDFLAKHQERKKLEVLRRLVKQEITQLRLWKEYEKAPKKYEVP